MAQVAYVTCSLTRSQMNWQKLESSLLAAECLGPKVICRNIPNRSLTRLPLISQRTSLPAPIQFSPSTPTITVSETNTGLKGPPKEPLKSEDQGFQEALKMANVFLHIPCLTFRGTCRDGRPHLWMSSSSVDQDQILHDKFLKAKTL